MSDNQYQYESNELTMTNKERADKFATFVSCITEYHAKFDEIMQKISAEHPEPDDEAVEQFRQSLPTFDIEALTDLAFRDAVLVWSVNQAKQDPNIIKSIGAILLKPADPEKNPFTTAVGNPKYSVESRITATDVVCMLLMAGGGFEVAFPLMAGNRFRMVTEKAEMPNLHELLTTALFLGSIDEENARNSILKTILECDTDNLWDMFQVNLDESALWADLDKDNNKDTDTND